MYVVCMYVCMHACMYVCMYVCMWYVCMYVCMHACMYVYIYIWIYAGQRCGGGGGYTALSDLLEQGTSSLSQSSAARLSAIGSCPAMSALLCTSCTYSPATSSASSHSRYLPRTIQEKASGHWTCFESAVNVILIATYSATCSAAVPTWQLQASQRLASGP